MGQEIALLHLAQALLAAVAAVQLIEDPASAGWLSVACLTAANATTQQSIACRQLHQIWWPDECCTMLA